ncbi:hypothetical protein HK104_003670 [Borealophlyctis nickersoniae]|nr:hypothetical protein HK104_003670 [Borealophlyctis nickersoniae]
MASILPTVLTRESGRATAGKLDTQSTSQQTPTLASATFSDDDRQEEEEKDASWSADEDDEDDEEFQEASQDLRAGAGDPRRSMGDISAPAEAAARIKLDKKQLKQILAEGDATLDAELKDVEEALAMFLDSRFSEAERFLRKKYCRSLYFTLGTAVITTLKAVMTFDPADVDAALEALHNTVEMASACRKEQSFVASFAGMVMGSGKAGSHLKTMTRFQRHAELVFAEAYLLKAILSLLTDTNMVAFVREGLNIRSSYNIYKGCYKFLEKEFEETGAEGLAALGVDEHFVSGVLLGVGGFNLILSMLPAKVLRLFEMIGFSGDRALGLSRLEIGGKWPVHNHWTGDRKGGNEKGKSANAPRKRSSFVGKNAADSSDKDAVTSSALPFAMPNTGSKTGGLRKPLCDLVLLAYHIIISSQVQVPDCDIPFAKEILAASLKQHPNGFIYLTLRGRLLQDECQAADAIAQYTRAMNMEKEWRNLVHVCVWEMGTCNGAMGRFEQAHACYETLFNESKWSKTVYRYLEAVYLYAMDPEKNAGAVAAMMKQVPTLMQRVAGKSIPLEKFVARKSRKFHIQGNRLLLPWLEMLYLLNGLDAVPPDVIPVHIKQVDEAIKHLESELEAARRAQGGALEAVPYKTYHDDLCLARFLKGVLTREQVWPKSQTLVPLDDLIRLQRQSSSDPTRKNQLAYAARQLEFVKSQASQIELDHWILPFSRHELGQLHMRMGDYERAKKEFQAALNGGVGEDEEGTKHKASLENMLHFRAHNALIKLGAMEKLAAEMDEMSS